MAKEKLSKAAFVERGYGQVEPNHLSAQRTGQIYAQLPAASNIDMLENGQFVKYDYENNEVNLTGDGEWMLVFNEVKAYESKLSDQDFALIKADYANHPYTMVPRVFKTNVGDIFTTNTVNVASLEVGNVLAPAADGYLATAGDSATMKWQVVKVYSLPDRNKAVKLVRIA